MSVFQGTSEGKLSHCASFKINPHDIPNNTPPPHFFFSNAAVFLFFSFFVSLFHCFAAEGQKTWRVSDDLVWCRAGEPALWSYAVCQHFAERWSIYCSSRAGSLLPTTLQWCSSFSALKSESRQDFWDPLSAAKLAYCSVGPKQCIMMS